MATWIDALASRRNAVRRPSPQRESKDVIPAESNPRNSEDRADQEALTFEDRRLDLERLTFTTYLSRKQMARRLEFQDSAWLVSISISSTILTIASVASVAYPDRLGRPATLGTCVLSIAVLAFSLLASQGKYAARARDVFHNYRSLQELSRRLQHPRQARENMNLDTLEQEYQNLLDSENHSSVDYYRAIEEFRKSGRSDLCGRKLPPEHTFSLQEIMSPYIPWAILASTTLIATASVTWDWFN